MTTAAGTRSQSPPVSWRGKEEEHRRKIAQSLRGVLFGQTNNHFSVTLDAGTVCTEVDFPSARLGVSISITPQNQVAATFMRTNDVWGEVETGKVKICHASTAVGTEKFAVVIVG